MISTFCGVMGIAGWLVMLLWAAVIAAAVWGITRLFPSVPPPAPPRPADDTAPPLVDAGHR